MGKIPRKLNCITGFVRSPYGLLPYEDDDDKTQLLALAQIIKEGIGSGNIISKKYTVGAEFGKNITRTEKNAAGLIEWHIRKNLFFHQKDPSYYPLAEKLISRRRWFFLKREWIEMPNKLSSGTA
jgi:hypothetical protein